MTPDQIRINTLRAIGLTPLDAKVVLALYADRDGPMTIDEILDAVGSDSHNGLRTSIARVRRVLGEGSIVASKPINPTFWMTSETHDRIGRILARKAAA
jgi:hypothetical protein